MNFPSFFTNIHTIAIVGLSDKQDRPSYDVAAYLQSQGFRIAPVNPNISEDQGHPNIGKYIAQDWEVMTL